MSAQHVGPFGTVPVAEDMTPDEILAAIAAAKRRGVNYTFDLYDGIPCQHCGQPSSPLMRFTRTLPREAWILGTPDDGSRDKLICAVRSCDPNDDPDVAASVVSALEDVVAELNASDSTTRATG